MPGEWVLDGHGGWNLQTEPAYAQVPRGTTIYFYTENLKILRMDHGNCINELNELFRAAEANQENGPYSTVPNYTLSPIQNDSPPWVYQVTQDTPFCTNDGSDPQVVCESGIHRCDGLFAQDELVGATLHWSACRVVELEAVGDLAYYTETGVNQQAAELGRTGPETETEVYYDTLQEQLGAWDDAVEAGTATEEQFVEWIESQFEKLQPDDQERLHGRIVSYRFKQLDDDDRLQAWNDASAEERDVLLRDFRVREWATENGVGG